METENTRKRLKNPFAFFGEKYEQEKVIAMMSMDETQKCAIDMEGKPSAIFTHVEVAAIPCVHIYKPKAELVLGSQRSEGLIEHKPTMLLEAPK